MNLNVFDHVVPLNNQNGGGTRVEKCSFYIYAQLSVINMPFSQDIEGIKYIITIFKDYYPYVLERIYVVEMPWILSGRYQTQPASRSQKLENYTRGESRSATE